MTHPYTDSIFSFFSSRIVLCESECHLKQTSADKGAQSKGELWPEFFTSFTSQRRRERQDPHAPDYLRNKSIFSSL